MTKPAPRQLPEVNTARPVPTGGWVVFVPPVHPGAGEYFTINFIIDGGGAEITDGIKGDMVVDFACTIINATLLADQVGSIVVDIWKDVYASFPPTNADTITNVTPPTIAAGTKSQDAALVGWITAIVAGDVLRYNVDSCATITRCTVALKVART